MTREGKKKHTVACSDIHCDPALLTSLHLVSHLVTSAEIISSLCHKAKRWIGYLRKGIGPLCTLWIIHCNMHGCHTLALLTFLLSDSKELFFFRSPFILSPCLCNYHVPISPCPHSHPQYPEGSAVFLLVQQLPPLSLWNKKFGVGY